MFVTQRFGMACSTIYHFWDQAKSAHELGVFYSLEFISWENAGRRATYPTEFVQEGVKHVPLRKRHTQKNWQH